MNSLSPYNGTPTQSRRSRNRPPSPIILPDEESDNQDIDTSCYLSWGDTQDIPNSRAVTQLNVDSAQGAPQPLDSLLDGFDSTTQGWRGGTQSFDSFPRDTSAHFHLPADTTEADNARISPHTPSSDSLTHSAMTDMSSVAILDTLECMFSHDAALNGAVPAQSPTTEVAAVIPASSQPLLRTPSTQSQQASPRLRQPRARTAHQTYTSSSHPSQRPPHSPSQLQQSPPLSQWHLPLTPMSPSEHQQQSQPDFSQLSSPQLAQDSPPHSPTPAPHSPLAPHVFSPLTQTQRLSAPVSASSASSQAVHARATPREREASPSLSGAAAAVFPRGIVGRTVEDERAGDGDENGVSGTDGGLAHSATGTLGGGYGDLLNAAELNATADTPNASSAPTAPSGAAGPRDTAGHTDVCAVGEADTVGASGPAAPAMQLPASVNTPRRGGKAERTPARARRSEGTPGSEGVRARGKKASVKDKDKEKDKEKETTTEDAAGSETPRRGILSFFMGAAPAAPSAGAGTGVTVGGSLFSTSPSPHADAPAAATASARSYPAGEVVCIDLDSDAEDSIGTHTASSALIGCGDQVGAVRARRDVMARGAMAAPAPLDLSSLPMPLPVPMPVSVPLAPPPTGPASRLHAPAAQADAAMPPSAVPVSSSPSVPAPALKTEQWPAEAVPAAAQASLTASTGTGTSEGAGAGTGADMGAAVGGDVGDKAGIVTKVEEEEADADDWAFGDDGGMADADMPSLPQPTDPALASGRGVVPASLVARPPAAGDVAGGVGGGAEGSQWTQEQDWAFGEEAEGSGDAGSYLQPLRDAELGQSAKPVYTVQPVQSMRGDEPLANVGNEYAEMTPPVVVKSEEPAAVEWGLERERETRVKREGEAEDEWDADADYADDWAFGDGFGPGVGDGVGDDEVHRSQPRAHNGHRDHDGHHVPHGGYLDDDNCGSCENHHRRAGERVGGDAAQLPTSCGGVALQPGSWGGADSQVDDWSFGADDSMLDGARDGRDEGYGGKDRDGLRGAAEWKAPTHTRASTSLPRVATPPPANPSASAFDDYAFLSEMSVLLVAGVELSTVLDAVRQQAHAGVLSPAQMDRICGALKHTHASLSGGSAPPPALASAPAPVPAAPTTASRAATSPPASAATTPAKPAPAKASRTPARGKSAASVASLPRNSPRSRPVPAPMPAPTPASAPASVRADAGAGRGRFRVSLLQEESGSENEHGNVESEADEAVPRRRSRATSSSDSDDDDLFSSDDDAVALEDAFAPYDMSDSDTGGFGARAPPAAATRSTARSSAVRGTGAAPAPAADDGDDSDADFFTNPLYQQRRYTAPSARGRAEAGGRTAGRASGGSRGGGSADAGEESEGEGVQVESGVTGKWITRGRQRCYVLSTGRVLTGAAAMRTYRAMQDAGQHDATAHRSTPKSKSKSKAKSKTTRKSKKDSADAAPQRKARGSKRSGATASRSRSRARGTVNDAFAPDAGAGAYAYEDAAMEEFEQPFGRAAPPAASAASSTASRARSTARPRAAASSSASSGAAAAAPAVGVGLASTFHDSPLFARVQSRVAPGPGRAAPSRPGLVRALELPVVSDISANDVGADGQVRGDTASADSSSRSGGARGERKRAAKEPSGRGKRARAEPEPAEATVVSASILPRALAVNTVVRPGVLSRAAQAPRSGAVVTGTNSNASSNSSSSSNSGVSAGPRKSGADLMQSFLGKR